MIYCGIMIDDWCYEVESHMFLQMLVFRANVRRGEIVNVKA
jgi:hypothetical protein